MSFVRPEARAAMWRFREVVTGAALLALGLYWAGWSYGVLPYVGYVLAAGGVALCLIGAQRARFRAGDGGPGVVTVDEGQITYFGPLNGGVVAVADLERLSLDPQAVPAVWVLEQPGQTAVQVPVNAAGSEALFDAFSTLPGLRTERMLAEMHSKRPHAVVIWERRPLRPVDQPLH